MDESMNESGAATSRAPEHFGCAWAVHTGPLSLEAKLLLWLVTEGLRALCRLYHLTAF